MRHIKYYTKLIALDALAGLCFVGVILFGWLPGPGGIPLFIAGLALLSVNHEWAERLLEKAKAKTLNFKKVIFPNKPWANQAYDASSALLIVIAIFIFYTVKSPVVKTICVAGVCLGVAVFVTTRERLDKMSAKLKKKKP